MNPQKNQESSQLLHDLQTEVSAESAPLLRFILNNASVIATAAIIFLLALGGTGIWRRHAAQKNDEATQALTRIMLTYKGADRIKALQNLSVPDAIKFSVYFALGQSALENGDYAIAARAYADAAAADREGVLGLTAALGEAGALLKAEKYSDALNLLQELYAKIKPTSQTIQLRQMLAEAAAMAGKTDLAAQTYQALANDLPGLEGAYFRTRATALGEKPAPDSAGSEGK
ncbi:MAG: hypothetical protein LBV65_01775 [Desulfovibrio sp.]|jgi:predicted negative regulator of RcsB-dependent stress response|nr:hypothetical protein [Desulfovibrio sp.]